MDSYTSTPSNDVDARDKPIMEFHPELWPVLERNRPVLNLDLFWPIKCERVDNAEEQRTEGDQKGTFPPRDLRPLVSFRNLHVLHLGGMRKSYQPVIWEACFVNANLTKLTLEMALEPEISDDFKAQYKKIDSTWAYDGSKPSYPEPTEYMYLGLEGSGELHPDFGSGEYLDRTAMRQAQAAVKDGVGVAVKRHLPIQSLTLSNFVVDAGPFFRWFDPERLREVIFTGTCWDAGFYLPNEMRRGVRAEGPQKPKPLVARVIKPGEAKVVSLSQGKLVKREDWDGENHLPDPEPGIGDASGGRDLKTKVSQISGVGKQATNE
ncbi:hypothetical protein A1O7_01377 [Cladophialophora yegresii CBS 114405]|uniref:Uncharacterized protein n=1 Tax=Cladophialophora yegresii CBS 114405 TaxID=1182544 RepID=W9WAS4_9EURO|nr:uncharacterized protein A1O7_01377 [Cladophialophora yegresii CBS 114405]EXJ65038.1 hypothetical protein A1O7_01377 [Cladophialophora yegresii CBS 114405]